MLIHEVSDPSVAGRAPSSFERSGIAPPTHTATLRREGEFWTVVFDGQVCRLKDSKGLRYLERLLCHPGSEFHVLDLVRAQCFGPDEAGESLHGMRAPAETGVPMLDGQAKTAYRHRLGELREQLSEAEQFNDIGRTVELRAELQALSEQLAAAVGLGGRDRVAASASERARSTVTQRLKDAIRKVAMHAPVLGDYLQRAIRTGTFCAYVPSVAQIIHWHFE